MRGLDTAAIISLLRADIGRAGGVVAWAKKRRLDRTNVSKTLGSDRPPSQPIIEALGLRIIVVSELKDGATKSVCEVDTTAVLSRLHSEIKRVGGPQAWARNTVWIGRLSVPLTTVVGHPLSELSRPWASGLLLCPVKGPPTESVFATLATMNASVGRPGAYVCFIDVRKFLPGRPQRDGKAEHDCHMQLRVAATCTAFLQFANA
jgi:hypothetical protein